MQVLDSAWYANATKILIKRIGNVTLNSNSRPLVLESVYHVPIIKFNLMYKRIVTIKGNQYNHLLPYVTKSLPSSIPNLIQTTDNANS